MHHDGDFSAAAPQGYSALLPNVASPDFGSAVLIPSDRLELDGPPPDRAAVEYFAQAVMQVFECSRCFAAMLPHSRGTSDVVRVGCSASVPVPAAVLSDLGADAADQDMILQPLPACSMLGRTLIGHEPQEALYAIQGTVSTRSGRTLVFVTGWRPAPFGPVEIDCAVRAVRAMWALAEGSARGAQDDPRLGILLQELAFPAFLVDERLRLDDINAAGRRLLRPGGLLRADRGTLSGLTPAVTERLKHALHDTMSARADRTWTSTTIALSTEQQNFAFAWVGAVPRHYESGQALVIVPQVDEGAGARRIAAAFGLSWAEERIVARILQNQTPGRIGADLGLTEATIRTYTKRIMLKLGINRQSELFLLYSLTLSPFGSSQRESVLPCALPCTRLPGRRYRASSPLAPEQAGFDLGPPR